MKYFLLILFSLIIKGGAAQGIDVQHYKYDVKLSDKHDTVYVKATISLIFTKPGDKIILDLHSLKKNKGMIIESAYLSGAADTVVLYIFKDNKFSIELPKSASTGSKKLISVSYKGIPNDGLIISKNKFGERTFFSDNWPNRAHNWMLCKDDPADKASVEFIVTAPEKYKVISNGILLEEATTGSDKRTHWKEELPIPTKVMVIGAAPFAVKEYVSSPVPVSAWVYKKDSAKGFYDYELAVDVVNFFSSYIHPYPFKKLANVQSTTIFGGMENASAIFYTEKSVTGDKRSEALIAHEVAHQWFGNSATEKSFSHLWLSEGFATYLTNIYLENKYGRDTLKNRLKEDRNKIIDFGKGYHQPVIDTTSDYMDLLNANSYQKGGWVLHMLRKDVGDSLFQKIIRSYYTKYELKNSDSRDFQKVAEEVSGKNLNTFFNQWLYQPEIPRIKMEWKQDGKVLNVVIEQLQQQVLHFQLPLAIVSSDNFVMHDTIQMNTRRKEIQFVVNTTINKIFTDPETELLFEEVK
jgi:aminopeptidase N